MASCKADVRVVYKDVIESVIEGCRQLFLEEGLTEEVLQLLKETWWKKLNERNTLVECPEVPLTSESQNPEKGAVPEPPKKHGGRKRKAPASTSKTELTFYIPKGVAPVNKLSVGRSMPDLEKDYDPSNELLNPEQNDQILQENQNAPIDETFTAIKQVRKRGRKKKVLEHQDCIDNEKDSSALNGQKPTGKQKRRKKNKLQLEDENDRNKSSPETVGVKNKRPRVQTKIAGRRKPRQVRKAAKEGTITKNGVNSRAKAPRESKLQSSKAKDKFVDSSADLEEQEGSDTSSDNTSFKLSEDIDERPSSPLKTRKFRKAICNKENPTIRRNPNRKCKFRESYVLMDGTSSDDGYGENISKTVKKSCLPRSAVWNKPMKAKQVEKSTDLVQQTLHQSNDTMLPMCETLEVQDHKDKFNVIPESSEELSFGNITNNEKVTEENAQQPLIIIDNQHKLLECKEKGTSCKDPFLLSLNMQQTPKENQLKKMKLTRSLQNPAAIELTQVDPSKEKINHVKDPQIPEAVQKHGSDFSVTGDSAIKLSVSKSDLVTDKDTSKKVSSNILITEPGTDLPDPCLNSLLGETKSSQNSTVTNFFEANEDENTAGPSHQSNESRQNHTKHFLGVNLPSPVDQVMEEQMPKSKCIRPVQLKLKNEQVKHQVMPQDNRLMLATTCKGDLIEKQAISKIELLINQSMLNNTENKPFKRNHVVSPIVLSPPAIPMQASEVISPISLENNVQEPCIYHYVPDQLGVLNPPAIPMQASEVISPISLENNVQEPCIYHNVPDQLGVLSPPAIPMQASEVISPISLENNVQEPCIYHYVPDQLGVLNPPAIPMQASEVISPISLENNVQEPCIYHNVPDQLGVLSPPAIPMQASEVISPISLENNVQEPCIYHYVPDQLGVLNPPAIPMQASEVISPISLENNVQEPCIYHNVPDQLGVLSPPAIPMQDSEVAQEPCIYHNVPDQLGVLSPPAIPMQASEVVQEPSIYHNVPDQLGVLSPPAIPMQASEVISPISLENNAQEPCIYHNVPDQLGVLSPPAIPMQASEVAQEPCIYHNVPDQLGVLSPPAIPMQASEVAQEPCIYHNVPDQLGVLSPPAIPMQASEVAQEPCIYHNVPDQLGVLSPPAIPMQASEVISPISLENNVQEPCIYHNVPDQLGVLSPPAIPMQASEVISPISLENNAQEPCIYHNVPDQLGVLSPPAIPMQDSEVAQEPCIYHNVPDQLGVLSPPAIPMQDSEVAQEPCIYHNVPDQLGVLSPPAIPMQDSEVAQEPCIYHNVPDQLGVLSPPAIPMQDSEVAQEPCIYHNVPDQLGVLSPPAIPMQDSEVAQEPCIYHNVPDQLGVLSPPAIPMQDSEVAQEPCIYHNVPDQLGVLSPPAIPMQASEVAQEPCIYHNVPDQLGEIIPEVIFNNNSLFEIIKEPNAPLDDVGLYGNLLSEHDTSSLQRLAPINDNKTTSSFLFSTCNPCKAGEVISTLKSVRQNETLKSHNRAASAPPLTTPYLRLTADPELHNTVNRSHDQIVEDHKLSINNRKSHSPRSILENIVPKQKFNIQKYHMENNNFQVMSNTSKPTYQSEDVIEEVKIILPCRPGMAAKERTCFIQVPRWLLTGVQLPSIITPMIKKVSSLRISKARRILQQHVNQASESVQQRDIVQADGPADGYKVRLFRKVKCPPIKVTKKRLGEADIDSDDDATDEETPLQVFKCENVIICQYTLVKHMGNRWTIELSNGIMHLNGKDYVFEGAIGKVIW